MENEALGVSIQYVGLDVHKDSIDVATADEGRGAEVRHVGKIGGDLAALDKALRRLISRGCRLRVVYEAGPCGFVIARHLAAQGIDCMVVAPSSIPWRPGNRVKTDRRDALMLARLARLPHLPHPAQMAVSCLGFHLPCLRCDSPGHSSYTRSSSCLDFSLRSP